MLTITNEDNMSLMARYPDKHFDLAIVDPPYGIDMGMGHKGSEKRGDKNKYKTFAGGDNSIPTQEYFNELFTVSKNQIIWGGNYMTKFLNPTPCFLIWDKKQPEDFSMAMCEFAWTSFKSPAKIFQKRIVGADSVRVHPTQKPVALYKWLLDKYAKPGQTILDTHLGSGSIAIACHDYGYDLTACELDKDYFDAAMKRINNHVAQTKLF